MVPDNQQLSAMAGTMSNLFLTEDETEILRWMVIGYASWVTWDWLGMAYRVLAARRARSANSNTRNSSGTQSDDHHGDTSTSNGGGATEPAGAT